MSVAELLWRNTVKAPVFTVGGEVCYYQSNKVNIVSATRQSNAMDEEDTYWELKVQGNDFWMPASQFCKVKMVD